MMGTLAAMNICSSYVTPKYNFNSLKLLVGFTSRDILVARGILWRGLLSTLSADSCNFAEIFHSGVFMLRLTDNPAHEHYAKLYLAQNFTI